MGPRAPRAALGLVVLAAAWLVTARADARSRVKLPLEWLDRDLGVAYFDAFTTLAQPPSPLVVNGGDAPRELVGLPVTQRPTVLVGVGAALEVRAGYLTFRLFEARYARGLVGATSDGVAREEPVSSATAPLNTVELGTGYPIPGLQSTTPQGRYKLGVGFTFAVRVLWTSAHMTQRGVVGSGSVTALGESIRGDVKGCLRLGETIRDLDRGHSGQSWGCWVLSPALGFGNEAGSGGHGLSFALRAEL